MSSHPRDREKLKCYSYWPRLINQVTESIIDTTRRSLRGLTSILRRHRVHAKMSDNVSSYFSRDIKISGNRTSPWARPQRKEERCWYTLADTTKNRYTLQAWGMKGKSIVLCVFFAILRDFCRLLTMSDTSSRTGADC